MTSVKMFAETLVAEARGRKTTSPVCMPTQPPKPAFKTHSGWSFGLDVHEHPPRIHLAERLAVVAHYMLSAKLYPPGRGSTDEDWRMLGEIVLAVTVATGHTGAPPLPLLPIESTHPNSTIMWLWHDDGSSVDEAVVEGTTKALVAMQAREREIAVKRGLAKELPAELKVGRNDPCPCKSGKKFKKCHGALN